MKTVLSIGEMACLARQFRSAGRRVSFVPTMGSLHDGHLSLVRKAREVADVVVVSIFVNPTQFGPGEDYRSYPRDLPRDSRLCDDAGVDVLFCPAADDMYASDASVYVEESRLSAGLCGACRPGHFRGVATVVAKLFNIVQPDVAVFGQKDAQQVRVIEQVTRDLNFPVQILVAPTMREDDGLAMSSRNAYLSTAEREHATCLYRALTLARRLHDEGARDAGAIRSAMRKVIEATPGTRIDYIEIADHGTLKAVDTIHGPTLIAVAVRIGRTRLIDNLVILSEGQ